MANEVPENQKEDPAFPANIEQYTAFLSEQTLAWVAVLLEGQSQILAHLRGTEPEDEKKKLLARLPGKQDVIVRYRAIESDSNESDSMPLSGA